MKFLEKHQQALRKIYAALFLIATTLTASIAHAEQFVEFGKWRMHYVAFSSNDLNVEVARRMGIKRSAYNAIAVLNMQEKTDSGEWIPAKSAGTVQVKNLVGQHKDTSLKKVSDADAHYLIAETNVRHHEMLIYKFSVQAIDDNAKPIASHNFKFQQKFWID